MCRRVNQAGTIPGKLSGVLRFHHVNLQMLLPTPSPLIKCAWKQNARSSIAAGAPSRPRRPIRGTHLCEDNIWSHRGGRAAEFFGCPSRWKMYFEVRSDEILASTTGTGLVHPVHCLRRDARGERPLALLQWHQATSIDARLETIKATRSNRGSVIVRTRDNAWGTRSGF